MEYSSIIFMYTKHLEVIMYNANVTLYIGAVSVFKIN